jgi:SAM-dependent methyltransferase
MAPRTTRGKAFRRNLPVILIALTFVGVVIAFFELKDHRSPDVPFVTTPADVVDAILELAEMKKDDVVYDLGCGDGRLVIAAARQHGCRGLGVDIDPELVEQSRANAKLVGVQELVRFRHKDIFELDLSDASVVLMYLMPTVNQRLVPQFKQMKPGSRIVSHMFSIPGMKPKKVIRIQSNEDQ